jgi:hypothetical protein
MAFVNNVRMMANQALGSIKALGRQAVSYSSSPTMLRARSIATQLARSPAVLGGAAGGAVAGAGYDYGTNNRSTVGSRIGAGIRGGMLGAGAGAAYKGFGMMGGRAGMANYGRQAKAAIASRIPKALHMYGRGVSAASKGIDAAKYYAGL